VFKLTLVEAYDMGRGAGRLAGAWPPFSACRLWQDRAQERSEPRARQRPLFISGNWL